MSLFRYVNIKWLTPLLSDPSPPPKHRLRRINEKNLIAMGEKARRNQKMKIHLTCAMVAVFGVLAMPTVHAQLVTINTVFVGNAGNPAASVANAPSWPTHFGYGAVSSNYRIGTTEVTISQYTTFLNAVATSNTNSYIVNLWNSNMGTNANIAGITRSGAGTIGNPYSYSVVVGSGNRPIALVSWFDAARFSNWLHNGATGSSNTETGAYTLNGAQSGIITKNVAASWWLPSEDEWVKAAYYNPTMNSGAGGYTLHANQSNSMTTNTVGASGGANYRDLDYATTQSITYSSSQNYLTDAGAYSSTLSFYGTLDQAGSVFEWNDAVVSGSNRGMRGGHWFSEVSDLRGAYRTEAAPTFENSFTGFRVANVPEPSTTMLMLLGTAGWLARRRRKNTL